MARCIDSRHSAMGNNSALTQPSINGKGYWCQLLGQRKRLSSIGVVNFWLNIVEGCLCRFLTAIRLRNISCATKIPLRLLLTKWPSAINASYARLTVFLEIPSRMAKLRVEGSWRSGSSTPVCIESIILRRNCCCRLSSALVSKAIFSPSELRVLTFFWIVNF